MRPFTSPPTLPHLDVGLVASYGRGFTGLTWFDRSGYGNDAALAVAPATWTIMPQSRKPALKIELGGYAQAPDAASLDLGTDSFTFAYWLRPDYSAQSDTVILSKCSNGVGGVTTGLLLGLEYRKPTLEIRDGSDRNATIAQQTVVDSTWQHLAVTRLGTAISWWINGKSMTVTQPYGTNFGANVDNSSPFRIGWNDYAPRQYSGQIADLRVYRRALSGAEINELSRDRP